MKRISLTISSILVLLFIGCSPINEPEGGYPFAIYFLRNSNLDIMDVCNTDLGSLNLKSEPWISSEDIEYYDWASHCMYLSNNKSYYIPEWNESDSVKLFPKRWANKPFVVVSNGNRCYLGYFFATLYYYYDPLFPSIVDVGYNSHGPSDIIMFYWNRSNVDNPLNNSEVKEALINSNLLHEGIQITLDNNTIRVLENKDTSTIIYTFTITNNDEDDLYILDPDKTGGEIFHYFTDGPVLYNIQNNKIYYSMYKEKYQPPSIYYWSPNWFTKIESMESIQRTVVLKGYPQFPSGEYVISLNYNHPICIKKEDMILADGRYWFGSTRSNSITWIYY